MSTVRINELVTAVRDRWLWVFGYLPQIDSASSGDCASLEVEGWIVRLEGDECTITRAKTGYCYCEGEIGLLGWLANKVIRYRVSEKLAAFTPSGANNQIGGESGSGARPCNVEWIRSIVKQCKDAGVPVFVKQLGSNPRWSPQSGPCGSWPDSVRFDYERRFEESQHKIILTDPKGGDPSEWPADLRVREVPTGGSGDNA